MWQKEFEPKHDFQTTVATQDAGQEEEKKNDELPRAGNKQSWYKGSVDYWDSQPATIDGVLGGYEAIHEIESDTSRTMINLFKYMMPNMGLALDCGAGKKEGIGRITKAMLKRSAETSL